MKMTGAEVEIRDSHKNNYNILLVNARTWPIARSTERTVTQHYKQQEKEKRSAGTAADIQNYLGHVVKASCGRATNGPKLMPAKFLQVILNHDAG